MSRQTDPPDRAPRARRSGARRAALVAFLVCSAVALTALPAAAHITVNPDEAAKGGFEKLAFRVPNELPDASTTTVQIVMPEDTPIAFVSVKPVPGWTASVEEADLDEPIEAEGGEITTAVTSITWTGGSIGPGEFQEFEVSAGPLPDTDQLVFKAVQTYDNGDVVNWIEEPVEGEEEPEHPAPVLTLVESSGDEHGSTTPETSDMTVSDASDGEQAASDTAAESASEDDDSSSDTLAIVAIVIGVLALIVGGVALARGRAGGAPAA